MHGLLRFQRGETQILGVNNTEYAENGADDGCTVRPEYPQVYAHYEMPSIPIGETGRGVPDARSTRRPCRACPHPGTSLPRRFPYAIRQVSEVIGSNGSTSMGSVCASPCPLLTPAYSLKAPVAGIAMGLKPAMLTARWCIRPLQVSLVPRSFGDMDLLLLTSGVHYCFAA